MVKLNPGMRVKYVGFTEKFIGQVGKVIKIFDGPDKIAKVLWDGNEIFSAYRRHCYHQSIFLEPIEEENIESIW